MNHNMMMKICTILLISTTISACQVTGGVNYDRCKDIKVSGHLHPSCKPTVTIIDGGVNVQNDKQRYIDISEK